jgi:phosphoglycolate phosphatase
MRNIGVLWGFGGEPELRKAGADRLASDPAQLLALLAA